MRAAPSTSAADSPLATALGPASSIKRHVSAAGPWAVPAPSSVVPRSLTTTRAPSDARHSAISRPIPPPAPVTTATLSSSNPIGSVLALDQLVLGNVGPTTHRSDGWVMVPGGPLGVVPPDGVGGGGGGGPFWGTGLGASRRSAGTAPLADTAAAVPFAAAPPSMRASSV